MAGTNVTVGLLWSGDYVGVVTLQIQAPTGLPTSVVITDPTYTIDKVVAGTYTLTLNVTTVAIGRATAVSKFFVSAPLEVSPPSASRSSADVGQNITFAAVDSGGTGGNTYKWSGLAPAAQGRPPASRAPPRPRAGSRWL